MTRRFAPALAIAIALPVVLTAQASHRSVLAQVLPESTTVSAEPAPISPALAWLSPALTATKATATVRIATLPHQGPQPAATERAEQAFWTRAGLPATTSSAIPASTASVAGSDSGEVLGYLAAALPAGPEQPMTIALSSIGEASRGILRLLQCVVCRCLRRARA